MKPLPAPKLESRRAADFERELITRARTWIPSWSLDESQADFGLALLKIAARFNSEIAERLDGAGEKMALGFLDWLGLPPAAARPARMPVVFKMADTAKEPVLAQHPVKLQVDIPDADTVTFETEADLQVIPGQLAAIVAADPGADAYYLPPPGLSSLAPLDPLPSAWTLKNFAAPKSTKLQLDPGLGLIEDMLIEIAGKQYRIVKAKDDLITIDPEVPAGGFEEGAGVTKVDTFRPFAVDGARNLQEHILYLGDPDLLNVEAAATIEILGFEAAPDGTTWEYWGKSEPENPSDADPRWRELKPEPRTTGPTPGRLLLDKLKGSVESTTVGTAEGRWIRARVTKSNGLVPTDGVALKINPRADETQPPLALKDPAPGPKLSPFEIIVNTTPSPNRDVYLFGQEPRLFDTLYVGSKEGFSKPGATAWIKFDLSDGAFDAMAVFAAGSKFGQVLAAVDKAGSLHIFSIAAADGKLTRLNNREPLRPEPRDAPDSSVSNYSLTSSNLRPVTWLVGDALHIAAAAGGEIWVRVETAPIDISIPLAPTIIIPATGRWEYWGSPSDNPNDSVAGMAVASLAGVPTLVVLTKAGVLKQKSAAGSGWEDPQTVTLPNGHSVVDIASVRSSDPSKAASNFITVTGPTAGPFKLRLEPAGTSPISNIDRSLVTPFGFEASGTTVTVAAKNSPSRLVAKRGNTGRHVDLGDVEMAAEFLDGNGDSGDLTVYGVGQVDGKPALLSWSPYASGLSDLLITTPIEVLPGPPKGPPAVVGGLLFLPGDRNGEVLVAKVSKPSPLQANGTDFHSAVAISSSVALPAGIDRVVVMDGPIPSIPLNIGPQTTAGTGDYAASTFLWFDKLVNRDTVEDDVFLFLPAPGPLPTGTVQSHTPATATKPSQSEFDLGLVLPIGTVMLVDRHPAGGGEDAVKIVSMAGNVATVEPELTANDTDVVGYRLSSQTVKGRVFPSLELNNSNNSLDVARALTGGIYFPDLKPHAQQVIAVAETGTPVKPQFLAFELQWAAAPAPAAVNLDFLVSGASAWSEAQAATPATAVLAWEYWDGTSWSVLDWSKDSTSNLRQSGTVEFTVPTDLKPVDWAGKTNHWVRARLIGGDYGEAAVEVVSVQNGNTTTQTVKRSTENLHPPFAVEVRVAYALDKAVIPTFLLTQDSGALRDQSDANRTPGAMVEIFTPLAETLRRLDAPASTAGGEDCVPDCDCKDGDPSTSPRSKFDQSGSVESGAGPSTGGRRAIFLGFTSKLLGTPVNLLFLAAKEGQYDAIAPLKVDALIGGRFASIVAGDDTRGLGESGLLKMTFDVEPLKSDLFGQALSWLRFAPSGDSASWLPSIAGIYLNGVWARSAETMTRELVGSSGGQPNLVLALGRPPLLQGSLELRVREPLGDEERAALLKGDLDAVKYDIADLPGDWVLWKQVGDPTDYGSKDRVYALDEGTGTIRFGDGLHGAIPPADRDSIVAFAYERTDPVVDGVVAANKVKPRQELGLSSPVETVESVIAADGSAGGVAPEAAEHVLQFAPATLRHRGRAVSSHDFEDLVRQKSNDVVQARCFVRNGRIRLVVVVRGDTPAPSKAQQRELRRMLLESGSPLLAATSVLTIEGPKVRRLRVVTKLGVNTLDVAGGVAGAVKSKLGTRFSMEFGGEAGEGWALGREPREEDIAEALLDVPDLESIRSIDLFELDEAGGERLWQGPVKPSELVMLAQADMRIAFEILEAVA